jgi:diacylglycerol kinase family enzyme
MMIAPDAKLADGLLDIVNIGDISTAKIILNSYTLYNGTHLTLSEVKTRLARRVTARPMNDEDVVRIEVDGELLGRLPATWEVVPNALRVRIPQK